MSKRKSLTQQQLAALRDPATLPCLPEPPPDFASLLGKIR